MASYDGVPPFFQLRQDIYRKMANGHLELIMFSSYEVLPHLNMLSPAQVMVGAVRNFAMMINLRHC